MKETVIRPWKPEDLPALREIWKAGFHDPEEDIDAFYRLFLREDGCLVAETEGKPVSAEYIVSGVYHLPDGKTPVSTSYLYALSTLLEYRGCRIGLKLQSAALDQALSVSDSATLVPSEPSLIPVYLRERRFRPLSRLREARVTKESLPDSSPLEAARLTAAAYAKLRETALTGLPHSVYPQTWYELSETYGTSYWRAGRALMAACVQDGRCVVSELLACGEDWKEALIPMTERIPASVYLVRTPLFQDGPGEERVFSLGSFRAADQIIPQDFWFPFSLE